MIKRHLITCSGLLLMMMLGRMFLNSSSANRLESNLNKGDFHGKEPKKETSDSTVNFANEEIPLHDPQVAVKMTKTLESFSFQKTQTRILHTKASQWFPIIEPLLEEYGIPEDFKYMPLVESGLKSGTSHRGASGHWQFMPQTARSFGLKVDGGIDERQDIKKSTIAACKYLRALYSQFNNWTLVAAAYNIGEGNLWKHIRSHKHRNYFKMNLNRETAAYVYKLASMKQIIEQPERYGYVIPVEPRQLLTDDLTPLGAIAPKMEHSAIGLFQPMQN